MSDYELEELMFLFRIVRNGDATEAEQKRLKELYARYMKWTEERTAAKKGSKS